jgi:hypothetical protein
MAPVARNGRSVVSPVLTIRRCTASLGLSFLASVTATSRLLPPSANAISPIITTSGSCHSPTTRAEATSTSQPRSSQAVARGGRAALRANRHNPDRARDGWAGKP